MRLSSLHDWPLPFTFNLSLPFLSVSLHSAVPVVDFINSIAGLIDTAYKTIRFVKGTLENLKNASDELSRWWHSFPILQYLSTYHRKYAYSKRASHDM